MHEVIMGNPLVISHKQPLAPIKIGLVVPVLNNFKGALELFDSFKTSHESDIYIQPQWRAQVPLARAWNEGARRAFADGCDYALVSNDDVLLSPAAVDSLVSEYKRLDADGVVLVSANNILGELPSPYAILTYPEPHTPGLVSDHPNFSCFLIRKDFFDRVGTFDENFVPAWYEDNDMHRRIGLLGMRAISTTAAPTVHIGGVSTNQMSSPDSSRSRAYYIRKWGGIPTSHPLDEVKEHHPTPFNDPALSPRDWVLEAPIA